MSHWANANIPRIGAGAHSRLPKRVSRNSPALVLRFHIALVPSAGDVGFVQRNPDLFNAIAAWPQRA